MLREGSSYRRRNWRGNALQVSPLLEQGLTVKEVVERTGLQPADVYAVCKAYNLPTNRPISRERAEKIKRALQMGVPTQELARHHGVVPSIIDQIAEGRYVFGYSRVHHLGKYRGRPPRRRP